jgi:Tol biopolymer transport system component
VIAASITLFFSAYNLAQAQTAADPFVTQVTASARDSFVGDISGNGRFVVVESTGDISTEKTAARNNADGNREIFLFDYVQRRIFQITDTKSATSTSGCPAASPTPTPTPSPTPSPGATPTPSPAPTPIPSCSIQVEISNNRPRLSNNGRWIVFSSNAITPGSFDGNASLAALQADGNQEVWLYFIPAVPNDDLSSGSEVPYVDLNAGTFTQVTNTPASRTPTAGTTALAPFVADDNREATVNDNASIVALTSTRNLAGATNNDANPEIFLFNRTAGTFTQVTNTTGMLTFTSNPSLSGSGGTLAFISNASIPDTGSSTGNNADANAEIYVATITPATTTVTGMRQVTRTAATANGSSVNILSPGRRVSRNGNFIAFESTADLVGSGALQPSLAIFIYNVTANTFTQVGPRTAANVIPDLLRFPTFTGDDTTLIFTSALNLKADGTIATTATEGLNPPQPNANDSRVQLFSVPVNSVNTLTRLTNNPVSVATGLIGPPALQGFASNTRQRIAFTFSRTELGGGNSDSTAEAFYLLTPASPPVSDTTPTVNFFTGASNRPVLSPSPTPTPPAVGGLAPGMLGIARSATALAPSNKAAGSADENRRPSLPVELNGVSVSINGAAAGLYFVGSTPNEIDFVVPPGLAPTTGTNTYPVVINNNGNLIRTTITILVAQPDIGTSTQDAGGRANASNITVSTPGTPEPFTVTSVNSVGATVPTILQFTVTGLRNVTTSQVTVRIGTTDITGASILAVTPTGTPGFETVNVQLPASLAGAGDVPVIISVTIGGVTYTSRPADTAPRIQIN